MGIEPIAVIWVLQTGCRGWDLWVQLLLIAKGGAKESKPEIFAIATLGVVLFVTANLDYVFACIYVCVCVHACVNSSYPEPTTLEEI